MDYKYHVVTGELVENDMKKYNDKKKYNDVFDATRFGVWHFILLAQCGWANASDAIEIMCISFTVNAFHDTFDLSSSSLTSLTIALFLGMMIGGYLWGSLADTWGRRKIIMYSLSVNGAFGVLSAFAGNFWLLVLLRFLSGIGAGGSLPVCFSYFSEFQPSKYRGAMISGLATSWMAGNMIAAGLAWLILPDKVTLASFSPYGEVFRFFIIICALPSLTSVFFFYFMPESPMFLVQHNQPEKAFSVLNQIHKFNSGNDLPFSGIVPDETSESSLLQNDNEEILLSRPTCGNQSICYSSCIISVSSCCKAAKGYTKSICNQLSHQFTVVCGRRGKRSRNSLVLSAIYLFIAFGSYGVTMWLPTLMQRAEESNGSPCSGREKDQETATVGEATSSPKNEADAYMDVFISCAAQLPANILTILFMDRIGGKPILIGSFALSAVSVASISFVNTKLQVVVMSSIFNCVSTVVYNALDVITPEMYETSVRASANGFLTALSRIGSILGNLVFGIFIDANCAVPLMIVSVVFIFGTIASALLPSTKNIRLS